MASAFGWIAVRFAPVSMSARLVTEVGLPIPGDKGVRYRSGDPNPEVDDRAIASLWARIRPIRKSAFGILYIGSTAKICFTMSGPIPNARNLRSGPLPADL